jgi:hypothetical protein
MAPAIDCRDIDREAVGEVLVARAARAGGAGLFGEGGAVAGGASGFHGVRVDDRRRWLNRGSGGALCKGAG